MSTKSNPPDPAAQNPTSQDRTGPAGPARDGSGGDRLAGVSRAELAWQQMLRDYPIAPREASRFRVERGSSIPAWPDWCYLPMAGSAGIVTATHPDWEPLRASADFARVAALLAWAPTKGIFTFHPHLADALMGSTIDDDLPVEVFYRLPQWGCYIALPTPTAGLIGTIHGLFVHLEHDTNTGGAELRLLLDEDSGLYALPIHLGPWSVVEAVARTFDEAERQRALHAPQHPNPTEPRDALVLADWLTGLISLVLYLCSADPDITHPKYADVRPKRPRPVKSHGTWVLKMPSAVTCWQVGTHIGPTLNPAAGTGAWSGSYVDERYTYRWITPQGVTA